MRKYLVIIFSSFCCAATGAIAQTETLVTSFQDLCWSPDSKTIYFSAMKGKADYSDYKPEKWAIYKYDLAAKSSVKITDSAFTVTVSPSGKEIATGKLTGSNRDIYIVSSNGKRTRKITSDPKEDFAPAWSPDGKRILFNSKRNGKPEIYVINANGRGEKRITNSNPSAGSYNPQWSPDNKRIVYYLEKGDGRDQVYVMNADGSKAINITNDTLLNYYPGWVNNDKIIYTRDFKNRAAEIITVSSAGHNKESLLNIRSGYARFSPDEKMVAYIDEKERCIKIVSAKGELIEKIVLQ